MKFRNNLFKLSIFSAAFFAAHVATAAPDDFLGDDLKVTSTQQNAVSTRDAEDSWDEDLKATRDRDEQAAPEASWKGGDMKAAGTQQAEDDGPFYYKPRFTVGPFYDTEVSYLTLYDLFAPYAFNQDSIIFVDARYKANDGPTSEGNYGLGMRHIFAQSQTLMGLYGFYDRRISTFSNIFHQVTVGGEFKSENWSFAANAYIPVGKKEYFVNALDVAQLVPAAGGGVLQNIGFRRGFEKAMPGGDVLVGWLVPRTYGLGLYLGGFYYGATDVTTAAGPIVHAEWTYQRSGDKRILYILSKLHLVVDYQHDNLRGNTWFAGARFDFMLGHQQQLHGIQRRMQDFVRRDLSIESGTNANDPLQLLKKADGTPVTVQQFSGPFTGSTADIIGVVGAVANGATSVTLLSNQQLNGGNFPFTGDGKQFNVAVGSNGSITSTLNVVLFPAAPITGNVIENITLTSGLAAISTSGNPVGTLLINNVTATGAVVATLNFFLGVAGTSNVTLENSTITGVAGGASFISAIAGANTILTVRNNTITNTVAGNTLAFGTAIAQDAVITVTEITNNILSNSAVGNALHITATRGSINLGPVTGNTITNTNAGAVAALAAAANGAFPGASAVNFNGGISNNTFSAAGTLATVFLNTTTALGTSVDVGGGFTNNTVTNTNGGATAFGLLLAAGFLGSTATITGDFGNTFSTVVAASQFGSAVVGAVMTINVNNGTTGLAASNTQNVAAAFGAAGGPEIVNPAL